MIGMFRTWTKPGVSVGTMNIEARLWGAWSGSVTAITMAKAAPSAAVVNHLRPLITKSSPSRVAVVDRRVGLEPALSGSVIEKQLRISPARSGSSQRDFWVREPYSARISMFPASGAWQLRARCPKGVRPSSALTRPWSSRLRPSPPCRAGICGSHNAALRGGGAQLGDDGRGVGGRGDEQLGLARDDDVVDEGAHAREQLAGRFGDLEVHGRL